LRHLHPIIKSEAKARFLSSSSYLARHANKSPLFLEMISSLLRVAKLRDSEEVQFNLFLLNMASTGYLPKKEEGLVEEVSRICVLTLIF